MRSLLSVPYLVFALSLGAQTISKLPDWAQPHASASLAMPPADADAWVLLDRTEIAYVGSGTVKVKRYRLTKVLTERGLDVGIFSLGGLGGRTSQVKRLKGWNARPDGEVKTLDSDRVLKVEGFQSEDGDDFSSGTATHAFLPMVVKGSLVAFESIQAIRLPMGPIVSTDVMESEPIRRWELEPAKKEGWFTNLKRVEIRVDRRHSASLACCGRRCGRW